MSKPRIKKTVLDGELSYLSEVTKQSPTDRGDVPLDAAAAKAMITPADVKIEAGEEVTIKLVSMPNCQAKLADWVRQEKGSVLSEATDGEVLLVNLPVQSIGKLNRVSHLQRAEAARVLLPRMDIASGPVSGLHQARASHSLSGDGVVFGIIDSGLDWRHPDFQDQSGNTRLELFSHAFMQANSDISHFADFDSNAINAALSGSGQVPQGDPHGHGTHCASIGVGNGQASNGVFRGVAPQATIMAMRSEPLLDTHTIRGIREFFSRAGDRPAVINLSLGGHIGAHDGTSAIENVIARESGPGRIVVVAAGNEGSDGIHWQGDLVENSVTSIPFRIADPSLQVIDVWIPRGDEVEIAIESPDGSLFDADGIVHSTVFGPFVADWREDPINHDQNLTLRVAGARNFTWRIHIISQRVLHGEVHAWGHTQSPSEASNLFPGFVEPAFSIGMPGTEERAIVVGSLVSKNEFDTEQGTLFAQGLARGQLSPFSSHGPTRIEKQKPDIAAPGQYITAALAANSLFSTQPTYTVRHHPTPGYLTIQGTSMAAPFVAGVIALMLEREPHLTPEEIQQRLRITAQRDDDTGRVWNTGFGYGKIDVEALLNYTP